MDISTSSEKETTPERLSRFGRNVNIIGALAVSGFAVIIPGPNAILASLAALNAVQAGGLELIRAQAEKKRKNRASRKTTE